MNPIKVLFIAFSLMIGTYILLALAAFLGLIWMAYLSILVGGSGIIYLTTVFIRLFRNGGGNG